MVVAGGGDNGGGGGNCCMKWWQHNRNHCYHQHHYNHNSNSSGNSNSASGGGGGGGRVVAAGFVFCLVCFVINGLIAVLYGWLILTPPVSLNERKGLPWLGCQEDNEGYWAIGVFFGQSPFSLKPIETTEIWRNESAAWPVANPVITCASASDSGFPSNFVADPFLYVQGDVFYLFYETKNSFTMQGDIGVAKSIDKGATWQQLGIALDEEWHLSYPYVFNYLGQVYMMPESSQKGELRLYRVTNFPLEWELDRVIMKKPLIDSFIIDHNGEYWLFGSEHNSFGTTNGRLEIWYSSSPLGPWKPHKKNPIYNTYRNFGARNGGRPFRYNGNLYRIGQDCGETYGRRVRIFKVEVLSRVDYKEVEVPFPFEESSKGRNAWNGARYHHLDVQQLKSGEWVGVMDGDRVPSGDSVHRFLLGCASVAAVSGLILFLGVLLGAVNCIIPLNWCADYSGKRSDTFIAWERANVFSSKLRRVFSRLNRVPSFLRSWIKPNTFAGRSVLTLIFALGVVLSCTGVTFIYGGSGAEEPYSWKGQFSQFTLLTMTYDARLWNLKMFVNHYSRCTSVKEILVVWNKGIPPKVSDLNSAVPVRIRVEDLNSLNNRFKVDPLIKTRAVLELDDDIMMPCDDVERGFMLWRQHPDRIVGFYPRYVDGSRLEYSGEKYARKNKGYNMILTGAAFMDSQVAFERYWSEQAKPGREVVDKYFNCEDVLMNFLYANASSSKTVEYVRPAWAIDTSKYKCTSPGCPVKKKVERSIDGQVTEIIYKGQHNHQPPPPSKHAKDTGSLNGNPGKQGNSESASQLQCGSSNILMSKKDQESSQATAEHISGTSDSEEAGENEVGVDEKDEDEPDPKRRSTEIRVSEPASSHRTVTEPRIIVQTTSEVDLLDDGYRWRKYGQKVVKGNPYPRSYYKCTTLGCNVRKHVERAATDPKAVITTYEGKHNHNVPAATTRQQ